MQNVVPLPHAQECCQYIRERLLQTEMLRQSYDEGGLVAKIAAAVDERVGFDTRIAVAAGGGTAKLVAIDATD
jgi:hypothetical protein